MPERKSFPLRLEKKLYDELKRWANAELRSVNGQIEFILRGAVKARRGAGGSDGDEDPHRGSG